MRCAIYFIPPRDHDLTSTAARWLGRDVYSGEAMPVPAGRDVVAHTQLTADARRYGFHATIKAPFRLAAGRRIDELSRTLDIFARQLLPFDLTLEIGQLGPFFAYVPQSPVQALQDLAASVVAELDHFRAPLSDADLARRNLSGLTERQSTHLMAWGYPYVFDEFRFHMTLTGPVAAANTAIVAEDLRRFFGPAPRPVEFSQLVVAVEPEDKAPFIVHSVHPLAASKARLRA